MVIQVIKRLDLALRTVLDSSAVRGGARAVVINDDLPRLAQLSQSQGKPHPWGLAVCLNSFDSTLLPRGTGLLAWRSRQFAMTLQHWGTASAMANPLRPLIVPTSPSPLLSPPSEEAKNYWCNGQFLKWRCEGWDSYHEVKNGDIVSLCACISPLFLWLREARTADTTDSLWSETVNTGAITTVVKSLTFGIACNSSSSSSPPPPPPPLLRQGVRSGDVTDTYWREDINVGTIVIMVATTQRLCIVFNSRPRDQNCWYDWQFLKWRYERWYCNDHDGRNGEVLLHCVQLSLFLSA